ncbi:hypothetical protein ACTIVE_3575 [Actinomadura verrucosospora]|uniref:Uncharacterized protein n=1 Tax=Actinomadura verrucosospora TaxID=46165 RepID=A0A7D3ZFE7_ACTVE|nr:hypothetical protein ACTIVE_3575 [Actinomadura verrucosospora]
MAVFGAALCLGGCGKWKHSSAPSPDPISHVYRCGERPALSPSSQGPLTLRLTAVRAGHDGAPVVDYTIASAMAARITAPSDTRPFRLLILDHGIVVGGQNPSLPLAFGLNFVAPVEIGPARPVHGTVDLYVARPCPGHSWRELKKKGSDAKAALFAMPHLSAYQDHRLRNILTARLSASAPLSS